MDIVFQLFLKKKGRSEEDGIPDVEEEDEEDDMIHETLFTFEAFESVWNSCFLVYFPTSSCLLEICQCGDYPHSLDIPGTLSRFRIIRKYATCSRLTPQASCQGKSRRFILQGQFISFVCLVARAAFCQWSVLKIR